jgi:HPt (histidine-containing phosphotransfer) domain-containing protein
MAIVNLDKESKVEPNLDDLSIVFHGMKSASGNIGAKSFSDKALKMELKAKSDDRGYINKPRIEKFRDDLQNLVTAIQTGIDNYSQDSKTSSIDYQKPKRSKDGNGEFYEPQAVLDLKDALEKKDVRLADKLLEELEGNSQNNRKLYQEISDLVLVSDFQGALQIIDTLNKDVNHGISNN